MSTPDPYLATRYEILAVADQDRRRVKDDAPLTLVDEDWLPTDADDIYTALLEAERMVRAARLVKTRLEQLMTDDVMRLGSVRLGDEVFTAKPDTSRKLIDPVGFLHWLGDDWQHAIRVDTPSVRITAVRALADQRGVGAATIIDTFFEEVTAEDAPPKLVRLPVGGPHTPKWATALEPGERGRKPKVGQ